MLLTRCISPEEAYRKVEWKVLILIGSLLSLGAAMEATGTGKYLAAQLIALIGTKDPRVRAGLLFPAHGCPDPTDVEPGGGHRHSAHRH